MNTRLKIRHTLFRPLVLVLALTFVASAAQPEPDSYVLPGDAVFPEGVTFNESTDTFYVGSTTDGTIFEGDLETGEVSVFAEGAQPTAIGMAVNAGRLVVAGGNSGNVYVYDLENGELLTTLTTPEVDSTFLNDVAFTPAGDAYITDSMRPVLFRVPAETGTGGAGESMGELEAWLELSGTPIEYEEGFNLNGIASSPDGAYLIVVQSNTGELFRIDTETKEVTQIDLGGGTLPAGDGILLDGGTLFVARNSAELIVPVTLSEDYSSGTVGEGFSDPSLLYPTTIAKAGDTLLVVNSQFNNRGEGVSPELPFTVSRIAIPQ